MMQVFVLPPKESLNSLVSLLSLKIKLGKHGRCIGKEL